MTDVVSTARAVGSSAAEELLHRTTRPVAPVDVSDPLAGHVDPTADRIDRRRGARAERHRRSPVVVTGRGGTA